MGGEERVDQDCAIPARMSKHAKPNYRTSSHVLINFHTTLLTEETFSLFVLTMKITAVVLTLVAHVVALVAGFHPVVLAKHPVTKTALQMGMLDNMFKPFHGHGTGEGHFEEMMAEERAVLKERKKRHLNKKDLKAKYHEKEGWVERLLHTFHGHGSGENDLDDMYKAQQQVLYERREYSGNKKKLRNKYKDYNKEHHSEVTTVAFDPADLNKAEDDAMYIDDHAQPFRMPWDKKLKP